MGRLKCFSLQLFVLLSSFYANGQHPTPRFYPHVAKRLFELKILGLKEELKDVSPANAYEEQFVVFAANAADFLELIFEEDLARYQMLSELEKPRLQFLKKREENPWRDFFRSEINLHWAFLHYRYGQSFEAFLRFREGFVLAKENYSVYPDFLPGQKTYGMLLLAASAVPSQYQWLASMVGMEGDKDLGWKLLSSAAEHSNPAQAEAALMKVLMQYYLLGQREQAIRSGDSLRQLFADSYLCAFFYGAMLMKEGESSSAIANLDGFTSPPYIDIKFTTYYKGLDLLYRQNYKEALPTFLSFIETNNEGSYTKDAYLRIAACHAFLGNQEASSFYLRKVLTEGKGTNSVDQYAEQVAREKNLGNLQLLKARYATDGGYYVLAQDLLKATDKKKLGLAEKIEYDYRRARLLELQGNKVSAKKYYALVIDHQDLGGNYFQPNACLLLGKIYLEEGDLARSKGLLEKAIAFEDHPYENDIESSAKTLLNKIGQGQ